MAGKVGNEQCSFDEFLYVILGAALFECFNEQKKDEDGCIRLSDAQ